MATTIFAAKADEFEAIYTKSCKQNIAETEDLVFYMIFALIITLAFRLSKASHSVKKNCSISAASQTSGGNLTIHKNRYLHTRCIYPTKQHLLHATIPSALCYNQPNNISSYPAFMSCEHACVSPKPGHTQPG